MVPGCAGMVPGYAVTLRYVFSRVILGYGDVAQRFKFAVPHRVLGVLDICIKSCLKVSPPK